jgi:hypothetical protein
LDTHNILEKITLFVGVVMAKNVGGAAPGMGEVAARFNEIEALQAEVKGHLDAIADVYARIAQAAAGTTARVGRPAGGKVTTKAPRKRGKRGALKEAITKVLAGGKTMGCSEVVAALPKVGYKGSPDPKIYYNTVYLALKNNKNIEKTKEGKYRLKASAK